MPTASATFEGLPLRGVVAPLVRGVSPSTFTLYSLPVDPLDVSNGTLTLSYGGSTVNLPGCAVASASFVKHTDGRHPVWCIKVLDRRWKWAGKTISGDWNRRTSDGTVDQTTAKTPGELASLLLQALGEGGFETSFMPTNVRPRALWKNVRADLALQALCDYVACEVVYNPLQDRIEIWPSGVGATTENATSAVLTKFRHVARTDVPSTVQVVGGETVFQHKLQLKCVLRNHSNGQQALMANWESKPTDWTVESPFSWPGQTDAAKRAIQYEAAYREFRVMGQQDGSLAVPNCSENITSTDQYLLNDYLLETETDLGNFKRNLPAYLSGDYYAWTDLPNNTSDARYTGEFRLDRDRRVVRLPYPLFKLSSSGAYAEPTLYLTTSYRVKSTTGQLVGIRRQGNVGGSGGTLVLNRPEIFAIFSSSTAPGAQTNTEAQANTEADAYVALFQQKYGEALASELTYAGLLAGSLDGRLAQITWRWYANRAATTCVCENAELDIAAVSRQERRRRQQLERLVEAMP